MVLFPFTKEQMSPTRCGRWAFSRAMFTVGALVFRRAAVAAGIALTAVAGLLYGMAPTLTEERSGDPQILADLAGYQGFNDLSVAVIDLDDAQPLRFANIGSTPTTTFEVGSITKALTGLVIADQARRGEIDLTRPVSDYLPLNGASAGAATLQELVTDHAGYPALGGGTFHRADLENAVGSERPGHQPGRHAAGGPDRRNLERSRQTVRLFELGAASGQAAEAGNRHGLPGTSMRTPTVGPLGTADTESDHGHSSPVARNHGTSCPARMMDGYAERCGWGQVYQDMSALGIAAQRTAPGLDAMTPTASTGSETPGSASSGTPPTGPTAKPSPGTTAEAAATPPTSDSTSNTTTPSSCSPTSRSPSTTSVTTYWSDSTECPRNIT